MIGLSDPRGPQERPDLLIESDVPIIVEHTRMGGCAAEIALMSTIAYPGVRRRSGGRRRSARAAPPAGEGDAADRGEQLGAEIVEVGGAHQPHILLRLVVQDLERARYPVGATRA